MITAVTWAVVALCGTLMVIAAVYARLDRLIDDVVLGLVALVEIGLLIQLVWGVGSLDRIGDTSERLTLLAYLASLPVVPVGTAFLAIKEKTRWSMVTLAVGAFAVTVMMLRCQQIWDAHATAAG